MDENTTEGIQKLLDNPSSTIEDIISSPSFNICLQQEYKPLLDYLSKDKSIRNMSKWIFKTSTMKDHRFNILSNAVLKVFASSIPAIFLVYMESKAFADICHSFLGSDDSADPKLCGFLFLILSQQIRWGNPMIFKIYDDVGTLLFARMGNLAIQDLIVLVASRQSIKIYNEAHLVSYLSNLATCMDSDMGRAALSILLQLYDTLSDESPLLEEFFEPGNVANLFKICCETKSLFLSSEVAAVLTSLYTFECNLEPCLTQYRDKLLLTEKNITPISVAFIPVFDISYIDIFRVFFTQEAHCYLHNYSSQVIMTLEPEDIDILVKETNFITDLINCYGTKNWCPHMSQISLVLARMTSQCKGLQFKEWQEFVKKNIMGMVRIIEKDYGGSPNGNDKEEEKEVEEEENEEEDEYYGYYSYDEEEEADIGQNEEMDDSSDDDE